MLGASMRPTSPEPIAAEEAFARLADFAILDVRDDDAFARGHLPGSGHLPAGEIDVRRAELPPRESRVLIAADDPAIARTVAGDLGRLEYPEVRWLDAPLSSVHGGIASEAPAARLWRPSPFLEEVLPLLPRGRAADLAAGAGRESVFLAIQGFEVEAWDADAVSLDRAAALAARNGVAIRTVHADLEARGVKLPHDAYALITCFRFLHRPLLPRMAEALGPGGMIVYETYRVGQERFGKPKRRRFLLEEGELARAFAGLEILRYEEPSPPDGPLMARLLARKND
jgi:tellurite methyltransferase